MHCRPPCETVVNVHVCSWIEINVFWYLAHCLPNAVLHKLFLYICLLSPRPKLGNPKCTNENSNVFQTLHTLIESGLKSTQNIWLTCWKLYMQGNVHNVFLYLHRECIIVVKISKTNGHVAVFMLANSPTWRSKNLTIEDEWGGRLDPHLGVDQVGSACLLGAVLSSHHLRYVGCLMGIWGKTHHLHRERRVNRRIIIRFIPVIMGNSYYPPCVHTI